MGQKDPLVILGRGDGRIIDEWLGYGEGAGVSANGFETEFGQRKIRFGGNIGDNGLVKNLFKLREVKKEFFLESPDDFGLTLGTSKIGTFIAVGVSGADKF